MRKISKLLDYTVTYNADPKTVQAVFDRLIEWYCKYKLFCGESICQSDRGSIEAPIVLSDIADDILQFMVDDE